MKPSLNTWLLIVLHLLWTDNMFREYFLPTSAATTRIQAHISCLDCIPSLSTGFPTSPLTSQQSSLSPPSREMMLTCKSDLSLNSTPCNGSSLTMKAWVCPTALLHPVNPSTICPLCSRHPVLAVPPTFCTHSCPGGFTLVLGPSLHPLPLLSSCQLPLILARILTSGEDCLDLLLNHLSWPLACLPPVLHLPISKAFIIFF